MAVEIPPGPARSQESEYYGSLHYHELSPFAPARLKLKRAKRHLSELERAAVDLPRRGDLDVWVRPKADEGKIEIVCGVFRHMPLEFAAAVGDAVHNIRAALDYVAIALSTEPIGIGNPANIYFPTGIDRQAFIKARDGYKPPKGRRVKGKMEGAPADALCMVEKLEPYGSGKHSIWPLHQLDIFDKHKLIVPTVSRITIHKLEATVGEQRFSLGVADFKPDGAGNWMVAHLDHPAASLVGLQLQGDFEPTFEIVFEKSQPLGGEPVVESLTNIADVCEAFIEECEAFFLRTN